MELNTDTQQKTKFQVKCNGAEQVVTVQNGAVHFSDLSLNHESVSTTCWASKPANANAADIVGAVLEGRTVTLWAATTPSKSALKIKRSLKPHCACECDSDDDAANFATAVQQQVCWRHVHAARAHKPSSKAVEQSDTQSDYTQPCLLVIVNPKSGPGKGAQVLNDTIQPMLQDAAGMKLTVYVTSRGGDATQFIQSNDLEGYDAIVPIGGDGTVHEVLQGIMNRADWDTARQIPLIPVPGGSGNGISAALGLWDPPTAVHAIVKFSCSHIDIASVFHPPTPPPNTPPTTTTPPPRAPCRYMFLLITYGLLSNLDVGTEHLRWMGGARLTLGAIYEIAKSTVDAVDIAMYTGKRPEGPPPEGGGGIRAACGGVVETPIVDGLDEGFSGRFLRGEGVGLGALGEGWEVVEGLNAKVLTMGVTDWVATDFKLHPGIGVGGGVAQVMYCSEGTRTQLLSALLKADTGGHVPQPWLKEVQCRAFVLQPRSDSTWLMVDGELVPNEPIVVEVHPRLMAVVRAPQ